MRKSLKIAVGFFLTAVVFGLFNLFGQPQQFVPPIYFDSILLPILALSFWFGKVKFNEIVPLLFLFFSFLGSGISEIAGKNQFSDELIIGSVISLLFAFILYIPPAFRDYLRIKSAIIKFWIPFVLLLALTIITLVLGILFGAEVGNTAYFYWGSGIFGVVLLFGLDDEPAFSESNFRFVLLISLSAFFDALNYFAIRMLF